MPITHPLVDQLAAGFAAQPELEAELFNPGAKEEAIAAFKAEIELDLPDSFYAWHNGSRPGEMIEHGQELLSLEGILATKKSWDDLERANSFKRWHPGTWWNLAWVPFIEMGGWFIKVIDTKGCFEGRPGQIISFDYKSESGRHMEHASLR
ncbi:MAG: hypothetical protein GYB68_01060 [Chloroflexi bacterium]|nr:hypothetical protein [Chloroflexota bacterium]